MNAAAELPRLKPGAAFAGPEFAGCVNSGRRPVIKVPACRSGDGPGRLESLGWIIVGDEVECDTGWWSREDFGWFLSDRRGKHPTRRLWKFRSRGAAVSRFQSLVDAVLDFNGAARSERRRLEADLSAAVARGDASGVTEAALALNDLG